MFRETQTAHRSEALLTCLQRHHTEALSETASLQNKDLLTIKLTKQMFLLIVTLYFKIGAKKNKARRFCDKSNLFCFDYTKCFCKGATYFISAGLVDLFLPSGLK